MRGGLAGRMLAASVLLALIVAGVFALLLVATRDEREAERRAERATSVVVAATTLERLVIDLQTGQRGFIITGQERFLEPWRAALREIPAQEKTLERLIIDPEQKKRTRLISEAIRSYVDEWSLPLLRTARANATRGRTLVADGEGMRRMDAIRGQFQRFLDAERTISTDRRAHSDSATDRARAVGLGGLAGFVLLILLFAGYLTRAVVVPVRRLSAAAGRLGAGDLTARVPEGGGAEIGELGRAFNAMAASVRESQEELDRFFTLSLEMLCIASLDGYFTRLNPSFERTLGYTAEELMSEPFLHFVHPDDREATLAEVEKLSTGLDTVAFENRYRCKDGSYKWILWSSTTFRERGLIYAAARDVTDRKRAEEAIRGLNDELELQAAELESQNTELESQQAELEMINQELEAQQAELERALAELEEEKERERSFFRFGERLAAESELTALANTILAGISDLVDAELGTLYVLEGDAGDALSLKAVRGLHRERLPAALSPGDGLPGRAIAEGRLVSASHGQTGLRLTAFGEELAVCHELHVPFVQGERVIGVATIARAADRPFSNDNVTAVEHLADQAAVALAHAVSFAAARHQASITRALLDATTDGIRLVDLEGETLVANAAIEKLTTEVFGLPANSTLYARSVIAERLTDPASYRATMEKIAADPECETTDEFELAGVRRSFQRYMGPVRGAVGELIGRIIAVREVTAEREAERLKSELVATVSHELRTPLASILGFAELLVERKLDNETRRRYLETIHGEARRLTTLINDVLDLQRIEEGSFTLSFEPFELGELLRDQVELFSAQSRVHTLELELPPHALAVVGQPERIGQVVANLLSNAIKYSPAGGPIGVAAELRDDAIRVSISDHGLGIPAAEQDKLFTKFFRVDSSDSREIGGTGLGLALCKEIVEAHGGRIGFASIEGEGSTFWFQLQAARREATGGRRVLVVEDDPAAASLLAAYLDADGHDVEVVASGEEAIERALADPPALVALDIGLAGGLDGWQVLQALKASPETADVPVVVCTAGNDREQAAALGAADFIVKPFSGLRLREAVARLLPAGGSVLVVDDEESVRRLVLETLSGDGLVLAEAADGEEALALVRARRPDALVLDLIMPRLDGFAVLERLQADPATRLLPVIVLTARRLSTEERSSLSSRAFSVLEKSRYSPEELRQLVQRALGRSG